MASNGSMKMELFWRKNSGHVARQASISGLKSSGPLSWHSASAAGRNDCAATPIFPYTCVRRLSLLDDEALDGAAEITAFVRKPGRSEARAIRTDPGFGIEQNPGADRLPRKTDGEVGIDERPFPEVQHG